MEQKPLSTIVRIEDPPSKTRSERQYGGPQSGLPPPFIVGSELAPYLIVGMDFGANYCRVSTFANGAPQHLKPHEYRAMVEDALGIPTSENQLVHSIKHALAGDYIAKKGEQFFSCEDIASSFLSGIKSRVEQAASRLMAKAVFSVPSCFTHAQRQTLIQAAAKAEIVVLGLINECTAAALDVCFRENLNNGKYLVLSIGSYTLDAAVIDVQNRLIEVKAIRCAPHLSGRAATLAMVDGLRLELGRGDPDTLHVRLDRIKPLLERVGTASVKVDHETVVITRTQASRWLHSFAEQTEQLLKNLLADALTNPDEIAGVILSGRAAKLWLVPEIVSVVLDTSKKYGNGKVWTADVSSGAATFAALLVRQAKEWVVWDAIANPVLVAQGSHIREVISVNSPLPINGHAILIPDEHGMTYATILQRITDSNDEIVQVANVKIVEQIQSNDPSANVDLQVHATADGRLIFTARHTLLDVNLTVEVTESVREHPVIEFFEPTASIKNQKTEAVPGTVQDCQEAEVIPDTVQDCQKTEAVPDTVQDRQTTEAVPDAVYDCQKTEAIPDTVHDCGIYLDDNDGLWFVRAVRDGTIAAQAGILVFDELLSVNGVDTFELGKTTPDSLQGDFGAEKVLTLSRAGEKYSVRVQCTVPSGKRQLIQLELDVAEATIAGDPFKLVQALLDYGNACADERSAELYDEARSALSRAVVISRKELKTSNLLRIQALCDQSSLHAKRSLCDMLQRQTILASMRFGLDEMLILIKADKSVPLGATTLLYDLATKIKELHGYYCVQPTVEELFERSKLIAANHRRQLPDYFIQNFRDLIGSSTKGQPSQAD